MKKDKKECKKGQETTIGKIIYGFLLFMPLLAISTTCLISTFNMSEKQEAEITYKYESNEVNTISDLIQGNIYRFASSSNLEGNYTLEGYIVNFVKIYDSNYLDYSVDEKYMSDELVEKSNYFYLQGNGQEAELFVGVPNNQIYVSFYIDFTSDLVQPTYDFVFDFVLSSIIDSDSKLIPYINLSTYNEIESVETHNVNAEDIFYRSVDKVTESPLFNWAENSIIYTTMSTTCTALSITAPFIPLLLSYWLIVSVIYFLYDIALMLIWLIHRKIHELQETI